MAFVSTFLFSQITWQLLPPCPWPHEHLFGFPWIYLCVFVCCEGCRALCAGRLYRLWQELPAGASSPWQECCRASLAPKLKATTSQANQTPPSLPSLVSAKKMTGRDIVPSGHSQLTAINNSTRGGSGEEKIWSRLFSAYTLEGFDFALCVISSRTKGMIFF